MNPAQVMNLGELLAQTARRFPTRAGLIQNGQSVNWQTLDQRVNAAVLGLGERGLKKGDKLLVLSRNNQALFESAWVAFRMGLVWVPCNFRLTPPEVSYLAQSSHARALLIESVFEEHLQSIRAAAPDLRQVLSVEEGWPALIDQALVTTGQSDPSKREGLLVEPATVSADDPLWFFYTSGTTGHPKAGMLTHGQMAFVVTNHLADLIPGTTEEDVSIAVAPLSHGAGIHMLLNVARGAATVLLPNEKLDPPTVWSLVEQHRVSNLFTVPTIVKRLVEDPSVDQYDHSSLRYVIYAGAPMYRADQRKALETLGPVLVQYFGLGEVTGCITVLPPHMHSADDNDPNANIGSCGYPRTGMEVAILDEDCQRLPTGQIGEICVRGPAVFSGYYNNPEATTKALRGGWFHTGDLGKLDERGFLTITGRQSDMYISGGSNVYPKEAEEVLLTHPQVSEVAIFGIEDPDWGETGVAVVVAKDPKDPPSQQTLETFLEGRLAKYRWPRHWFFWTEMPKSGYGKIVKKDLKAMLESQGQLPSRSVH
ncbi:MAG: acyl-CoA synthetase [Burkholderiaceae bacterium]